VFELRSRAADLPVFRRVDLDELEAVAVGLLERLDGGHQRQARLAAGPPEIDEHVSLGDETVEGVRGCV